MTKSCGCVTVDCGFARAFYRRMYRRLYVDCTLTVRLMGRACKRDDLPFCRSKRDETRSSLAWTEQSGTRTTCCALYGIGTPWRAPIFTILQESPEWKDSKPLDVPCMASALPGEARRRNHMDMDQSYEKKSTSTPVSVMKTIILKSVFEYVLLTPRAPQLQC